MIELHSHSNFSDGYYNPAEHIRRAFVRGYNIVAITDHGDSSNIDIIIPAMRKFVDENNKYNENIKALCGIELTHVLPESTSKLIKRARELGADIVSVHGETLAEPVVEGTNMAAIDGNVDVLCHPGLISEDEILLAAEKGIYIEITTRKGHSLTNGHVYNMAKKYNAKLVLNNDAHCDSDFVSKDMAKNILKGCGMSSSEIVVTLNNSQEIAQKILEKNM